MTLAPISADERSRLLTRRMQLETEIFCARLHGDRPSLRRLRLERDDCLRRLDRGRWSPHVA